MNEFTSGLRRIGCTLVGALAVALAGLVVAQEDAPARVVENIEYRSLPGDAVQLILTLSEPAPEPLIFTVDNPARLSIDLVDTGIAVEKRYQDINIGPARAVAAAEGKGRSRVVVELIRIEPYDVRINGNQLIVTIGQTTDLAQVGAETAVSAIKTRSRGRGEVSNVDFRRGENGEGMVVVQLSDPSATVDVRNEGGLIVADFSNAKLPSALAQRLEVLDFATPVKYVDVEPRGATGTRVVITPVEGGLFEQVAYQAGNQFTIELQPLTEAEKLERKTQEQAFTGERLSLNFQNVDVRQVLQIVADVAQVNMVVDDTVKGEMALRLDNVPWDQALDIILRARNLGKVEQGNVIFVAPALELAKREEAKFKAEQARTVLAPLVTEIIQVNYAKAEDLAEVLKPKGATSSVTTTATGSTVSTSSNTVMSDRGRVTVDTRTNTLIVSDTRDKLAEIRKLIKTLDIPVRQVLIEGRVVIANDNFSRELGTRFGFTGIDPGTGTITTTSGSAEATGGVTNTDVQGISGTIPVGVPALNDRFNVNLPVANPAGRIALAILGSDYLVDLELTAMQAEGRGEILSNPRVITTDRKEGRIKQGVSIPIVVRDLQTGIPSVTFIEALLNLTVSPLITPDDSIIMDLKINRDEPDFTRLVDGNPSINKREIITQVQVRNGETVVLGGVYENVKQDNVSKVPVLGDIPLLGVLFRTTLKQDNKNELLIFVTPKLLKQGIALN